MIEKAHKRWITLSSKYSQDQNYLEALWSQLFKKYSEKNRHYHDLKHIWAMLAQSEENKKEIEDYDAIEFAIWFHDIIYKSTKKNNEEKSANFAKRILTELSVEQKRIEKVYQLIISTKKHQIIDSNDLDNSYMLDFDLSILGKPWRDYEHYIQQIRKEYRVYPDFLYKPGRKKVLEYFLNRKTLYFTSKYQTLYEDQARENIKKELKILNS